MNETTTRKPATAGGLPCLTKEAAEAAGMRWQSDPIPVESELIGIMGRSWQSALAAGRGVAWVATDVHTLQLWAVPVHVSRDRRATRGGMRGGAWKL